MIHINVIEEVTAPLITKMPAAEFCGRGNLHEDTRFIYEIEVSPNLMQLIELVEAALDALPPMFDADDKGDERKRGGAA